MNCYVNLKVFDTVFIFSSDSLFPNSNWVLGMILGCNAYVETLFLHFNLYMNKYTICNQFDRNPYITIDKSSRCDYCANANISVWWENRMNYDSIQKVLVKRMKLFLSGLTCVFFPSFGEEKFITAFFSSSSLCVN